MQIPKPQPWLNKPWPTNMTSRGTKPRFGFQPVPEPKMCLRGMAYLFPAPEQRVWSVTSNELPTDQALSYT